MSPPRLSEASLHSARSGTILPTYDRGATRFGIVHIGPGAFHRAHQAFYADTLLHSDKRWAISALRASPHPPRAPTPRPGRSAISRPSRPTGARASHRTCSRSG